MEWMLLPIKRYADFSGRSRRKEYWMFQLFILLLSIALVALAMVVDMVADNVIGRSGGHSDTGMYVLMVMGGLGTLALIVPSMALEVRRFHDQGRSGWFWLVNLVPYVGGLIVLILMCMDGQRGDNAYGPDPKQAP